MTFGLVVRSLAFELGRTVLILVFAILAQLFWLTSYKNRYGFLQYWTHATLAWLRITCGLSYRVHGAEHINPEKPAVILAHHESAWETIAIQQMFPRQCYVMKKELLWIPFFGWTLAMLHPIAIDRSAGRQALKQLLEKGKRRLLQQGDWVVIFPEGTRVPTGTMGKINKGGAMLAKAANVPVYLVSHNAGKFWPKNSFLRKPGVIDVYISPALDVQDLTVDEINQTLADWISQYQTSSLPEK